MQAPGPVGTRVDRYQVEHLLGAGGFGAVYRARHVHTDAAVALKLLKRSLGADQGMLERFLREARAAAAVGSEHIVRVLDAGLSAEGQAFLALEFLEGADLKELAARAGPLSYQRLVLIVLQALDALEAAHARGIVHRDMKPANVFVVRRRDERGTERDFVKLLDFGISKMHGEAGTSGLTMTGTAMGTPSYMAPEQFFDASRVDARADLYSVAAMLYELLCGQLPLDAESYAHLIVKVRTEQPRPLQQLAPHVPAALAQAVMVGLAKEPQQRWQSAGEMREALRASIGLPAPGAAPAFLPAGPPPDGPRSPAPERATPAQALPATPSATLPSPAPGGGPLLAPVTAPPAPPAPPSGRRSTSGWVMAILGVFVVSGGCCVCGTYAALAKATDEAPSFSLGAAPPRPRHEPKRPHQPGALRAKLKHPPALGGAPAPQPEPGVGEAGADVAADDGAVPGIPGDSREAPPLERGPETTQPE